MAGFSSPARAVIALGAALTLLGGCASNFMRTAPPEASFRRAVLPGFEDVRFWTDAPPSAAAADREAEAFRRGLEARAKAAGRPVRMRALALSGGAADGAYGAGVLNGWSRRGDRPEFDLVSGISTGALIAPFAFLGRAQDARLAHFFTETKSDDIAELTLFSALLGGLSLADASPLRRKIDEAFTDEMLRAVGREHRRGRRLLVGTTNLDARQPMIWNMGAIAARGTPAAFKLFRDVVAASTAIPGAFQPQFFEVRIDGARYKEMHVDGGVANSVFIGPQWFGSERLDRALRGAIDIYLIQNNKITPSYSAVDPGVVAIAGASISELIRIQSKSDLLRIYALARRLDGGFHLATVPAEFEQTAEEEFDPVYMRALFDLGVANGRSGKAWAKRPPDLPKVVLDAIEAQ